MSRRPRKQQNPVQAPPQAIVREVVFERPEALTATWRSHRRRIVAVCLCLMAATFLVYSRVGSFRFIDYDDNAMVYENAHVKDGLTWDGIEFAFTDLSVYYWQPLTWLSHMLDCQLFGLNPGPPHLESAAIHALNTVLLFLLLLYATGAEWRSSVVAALFALHPLRVESVAWIAERRDVLCGLFSILTLWAYVWYAGRPGSRKRFAAVMAAFWLALMSKPMAIPLPLAMLLLDRWPLARFQRATARKLILEKIPLFLSAAVAALLTMIGNYGKVVTLDVLPLPTRIACAFAGYSSYLGKLVWPRGLCVFYPHTTPGTASLVIAGAVVVVLTFVAVQNSRRRPYVFVGWFWFLILLVPVIGLVQSGGQLMADRFTYLPLVGPSMALVWFAADWLVERPRLRPAFTVAAVAALVVLGALSFRQTGYWSDKLTMYRHTLDVTGRNERMWYFYARALAADGYLDEAERSYRQAIRLEPGRGDDHEALALLLMQVGRTAEAVREYREVIRLEPENLTVLKYLGLALIQAGSPGEALDYLRTASRLAPGDAGIGQLLALASTMVPARAPDTAVAISDVHEAEQSSKLPTSLSWSSLSTDESLESGLLLGFVAVAFLWPAWGKRSFSWCEHALVRLVGKPWRAMALVALAPMAIRLLYLPIYSIPEPTIHDEFGYLLLADTFASGRVANPPHPMRDHFESIYILQNPSYTSYYPFAPGLALSPARILGLNPWFAVWCGVGLMCASFCWMLAGWMPPRWALLGALLAAMRLGVLSHWMNSYWGGAVAAFGGALVFGALPRIVRGGGARYSALLGVGIAILAQSRPYEGLLVSLPVGVFLLIWLLGTKSPGWKARFFGVVLPLGGVLVCAGLFSAYYNWRVTGNPAQLPYQLYQKLYGVPQSFYWQKPLPPGNSTRFADLEQNYIWQLQNYNVRYSWRELLNVTALKLRAFWAFYLQPVWTLPLLALPWMWKGRRLRFLLITALVVLVGVGFYPFFFPHYLAPICGVLLIVVIEGLRRIRLWEWRKRPVGAALARAVVTVSAVGLLIAPAGEYMMNGERLVHKNTPRQRILNTLDSRGGRHDLRALWAEPSVSQ